MCCVLSRSKMSWIIVLEKLDDGNFNVKRKKMKGNILE